MDHVRGSHRIVSFIGFLDSITGSNSNVTSSPLSVSSSTINVNTIHDVLDVSLTMSPVLLTSNLPHWNYQRTPSLRTRLWTS